MWARPIAGEVADGFGAAPGLNLGVATFMAVVNGHLWEVEDDCKDTDNEVI